jgi:Fe-S cluster assembly ATP-binding protein
MSANLDCLLEIKNLKAQLEEGQKSILKGIDLKIGRGEVHAIMGLNGSGKSTLASILGGKDGYEVTEGSAEFMGKDLLEMDPEERAREGLFLAFQYPVELPGVLMTYFLRTAYNSQRQHRGESPLGVKEFNALLKEKAAMVELDETFLRRAVNEGFSGGEKKRNEIFQMALLDPKLAIMDETDSGLDIDALQTVAHGVNKLKAQDPEKSFLIITHYQRLLNFIQPDFVHILLDGKIVKSGGRELALQVEENGYNWIKQELASV